MAYETLEAAQERILELEEQVTNLTTERDSLSNEKDVLTNANDALRTLNQKYFNKLIAQESKEDGKPDDKEVETCEQFAAKLDI